MRNIPYSIISLFLVFIAVATALVTIFPRSALMAGMYLTVAIVSFVLILLSYCVKCPCRDSECRHMFPGKLTVFLPKGKDGPSSFFNVLLSIIGVAAIALMPQLWLVWNIPSLILFWVFMIVAGFMIVFLVCPQCPNTWKYLARVKKVYAPSPSAWDKLKSVFRPTTKKTIALLVLSLGIMIVGYFSLGLFIIQPVGIHPKGITVIYSRFGINIPFISYVFLKESEHESLLSQALAVAKPIFDRKIVSLPYSPGLYVLSTGGAELQNTNGKTSANRPYNSMLFNPNFPLFRKSRDSIITYFFIGHSNMDGYCAQMNSETWQNVWLYTDLKGFYHGADNDLSNNSGSPIMPFLKRMALLYPEYHFCGVKCARPGMTIEDFLANKSYSYIINKIKTLKKKSVIGGVLLMFGFDEGGDIKTVRALDADLRRLMNELRDASGNRTLPFIFGRYEENGGKAYAQTHRWDAILINKIASLEMIDPYLKLTPIRPVPKLYYCDDHHYTSEGYQIWADDAAAIIQKNKLDFWKGR
jgi:hypothetical protein